MVGDRLLGGSFFIIGPAASRGVGQAASAALAPGWGGRAAARCFARLSWLFPGIVRARPIGGHFRRPRVRISQR